MANNLKTCPYCKGKIDIDYDMLYEHHGNRYYHRECWAKKRQDDKDAFAAKNKQTYNFNSILAAAKKYLGDYYVEASVRKQAEQLSQKYAHKDICEALKYFYELKQNDPSKSNGGIAIVDYIINDSIAYYKEKERIATNAKKLNPDIMLGYKSLKEAQPRKSVRQKITKPKHVKYCVIN